MRDIYCPQCGEGLIRTPKPAEKLNTYMYNCVLQLGSKYNTKTGMRQFGIFVTCPNNTRWNKHVSYVDENSLHDSNLDELCKM